MTCTDVVHSNYPIVDLELLKRWTWIKINIPLFREVSYIAFVSDELHYLFIVLY